MDYIDAHVHVWTPDTARYPLAPGYTPDAMQPASFTPEELFSHCRPSGVARIVLVQMSFYGTDNRYMLDTIARVPEAFRGIAVVDRWRADLSDELAGLRDGGVRGLRIQPEGASPEEWLTDDGYLSLFRIAGELGIAVCPLIDPEFLPAVAQAADVFPGTTIVVDHLARVGIKGTIDPEPGSALCDLASRPNCYVKVSAFYALGRRRPPYEDLVPLIHWVYDAFGPDRLMWGSDCPYQVVDETYEDSISLVRDSLAFLSAYDRDAILAGTAERVFFGA